MVGSGRQAQVMRRLHNEVAMLRRRLTRAEGAARAAYEAAESAQRSKSEFLAHVRHELRTPLNAIIGFSEILGDGSTGALTPVQEQYVEHIRESGRNLLCMANDLLEVAELRDLELAPVDLGAVAVDAVAQALELANQLGVRVEVEVEPALPPVLGEARQLQKSLAHVLRNAVKLTPSGEPVRLAVRAGAERAAGGGPREVVASVSDSGFELDDEQLARLFHPAAHPDGQRRLGLGLALARKVVELQGGRLWADSAGPSGSTLHLALPAVARRRASAEKRRP